jgi:hypothetical protein
MHCSSVKVLKKGATSAAIFVHRNTFHFRGMKVLKSDWKRWCLCRAVKGRRGSLPGEGGGSNISKGTRKGEACLVYVQDSHLGTTGKGQQGATVWILDVPWRPMC